MVEPDPETGKLRPAVKYGEPVYRSGAVGEHHAG